MAPVRILHLVGSACDDFHCDLSRLYAGDCLVATTQAFPHDARIAYVTPDQQWRFPASLRVEDIAGAPPMPMATAVSRLVQQNIDLVLPQMFCLPGMTHYRALFELLKIPVLGNSAAVMALAADKAKTKAVVAAAGVKVPRGEVLRPGNVPTLTPPVVVKPVNSDNSLGVTLVNHPGEYAPALKTAFEYAEVVLVEEFIPLGREVRCGILCQNHQLLGLPLEEYWVDQNEHPIRNYADKLKRLDNGDLKLVAKDKVKAWIVDPADPITERVQAIARQCHLALGCGPYSLFDFRIDPQGQPWFLEAGLYCSFSPQSVIVMMARAAGIELQNLLASTIQSTLNVTRERAIAS